MADNYIQAGVNLEYTNGTGSDIASGDLVKVGLRVGVALVDIDDGDTGVVAMSGIYEVTKQGTLVITQGDLLYLDATSGQLDKTTTSQFLAGYAWESEASAAVTVKVKLNG